MGKIRNKEHKMRNKEVLTPYKWKKLLQSQAFQLSYLSAARQVPYFKFLINMVISIKNPNHSDLDKYY